MQNLILTSSFQAVAHQLRETAKLPVMASVAFIPTAGDPYPEKPWIEGDRKALINLGYSVTEVDLKGKNEDSLREEFKNIDMLFLAGGNTTYLTHYAHLSGFDAVVRESLQQGKMYIGSSAGSILAGPTVEPFLKEDASELPADFVLADTRCLGLVDYVVLPHDNVQVFSLEHDRMMGEYQDRFSFVRLTDSEYRVETVS